MKFHDTTPGDWTDTKGRFQLVKKRSRKKMQEQEF